MFEGITNKNGERNLSTNLTPEEKKRRVVLKRVNMDGAELRQNFLRAGTMARVSAGSPCNVNMHDIARHSLLRVLHQESERHKADCIMGQGTPSCNALYKNVHVK